MNRYLLIGGGVLIILLAAWTGWILFASAPSGATQQNTQTTQGLPNDSTRPGIGATGTAVVQQRTAQEQSAEETYQRALTADGDPDNIQPGRTSVSGNYALQAWSGDNTGGAALLLYDSNQNKWTILDPGGGAWSVAGLVSFGVPEAAATSLLNNLHQ